jgi:dTDP-4-amino-4,6-dideoxygalactose transaminase
MKIPFNRPFTTGREFGYIREAIEAGHLSGNGQFTRRCQEWLVAKTAAGKALLTHSCTAALEMCAMLLDLRPGDEVIMPSYTFVSTANAFVLRGAVPVFVDIRSDTLNIDERLIESAITPKTRAICVVHYAGVACEMEPILAVARSHGLPVIEDAAQGTLASYSGRQLGSIGALGALSFHETKNIISGEGGALLVNDARYAERAEILWEKGTNRSAFYRGEVDKYTWVDIGSSYLPSDLVAAFLWSQLEQAEEITQRRRALWEDYYEAFETIEAIGLLRRPVVPEGRTHNAHMFYVLTKSADVRDQVIKALRAEGILSVFHYVPLHTSPAGRRFGRTSGDLDVTVDISDRLLRLPLWVGLGREHVRQVVQIVERVLKATR